MQVARNCPLLVELVGRGCVKVLTKEGGGERERDWTGRERERGAWRGRRRRRLQGIDICAALRHVCDAVSAELFISSSAGRERVTSVGVASLGWLIAPAGAGLSLRTASTPWQCFCPRAWSCMTTAR
eukprot:439548-Hanusia_phi.AAC.2